jgi:hypothetical protein
VLLKKLSSNIVVQECFQEYLIEEHIFDTSTLKNQVYMADYLLINLLDQIWIQEFYTPCIGDVTLAYEAEI